MSGYKDQDFKARLTVAANAKKAMLERFRAKPGLDDPAVVERRNARQAISDAREARLATRRVANAEEATRRAAEQAARESAAAREAIEQAARAAELNAEEAAKDERLEIARKAARDARYAARKARK